MQRDWLENGYRQKCSRSYSSHRFNPGQPPGRAPRAVGTDGKACQPALGEAGRARWRTHPGDTAQSSSPGRADQTRPVARELPGSRGLEQAAGRGPDAGTDRDLPLRPTGQPARAARHRGGSSVGRAPALQAGCQEFESPPLHFSRIDRFVRENVGSATVGAMSEVRVHRLASMLTLSEVRATMQPRGCSREAQLHALVVWNRDPVIGSAACASQAGHLFLGAGCRAESAIPGLFW